VVTEPQAFIAGIIAEFRNDEIVRLRCVNGTRERMSLIGDPVSIVQQ